MTRGRGQGARQSDNQPNERGATKGGGRLCIFLCFIVAQNHLRGQGGRSSFFSPAKTSYVRLAKISLKCGTFIFMC